MWISRKKYRNILDLIDELGQDASSAIEDFKKSIVKLSESVKLLHEENKIIREELSKKNDFIEQLLSQMISGAVSSISVPRTVSGYRDSKPYEPAKTLNTMSVKETLEARKNGELPKLPG